MITLKELKLKQSETEESLTEVYVSIKGIIDTDFTTKEDHDRRNKQLTREKARAKKLREQVALYKLIHSYISSGVQMEGIKQQRNQLMTQLSSIKDREAFEGINRMLTDKENKKVISAFETKYKVKKLRLQLKVLNFILK